MEHRQKFRGAALRAAPIHEAKQRHQEKRLGIAGDEKERRRMRDDGESAEKVQERRDIPAIAKEKKITPETPGRDLGGDEQRVVGAQDEDRNGAAPQEPDKPGKKPHWRLPSSCGSIGGTVVP